MSTPIPHPLPTSITDTLELALVETLHALGVSEATSQRLLEHTLDPDGLEQRFFAACDLKADLRQARNALEAAQAQLATLMYAAPLPHADAPPVSRAA